jgi:hypothetical protein
MNAHDMSRATSGAAAEEAEDGERQKSGVRATRVLAELFGLTREPPAWSKAPPTPLLPHDPVAFEREPPYPDCAEVLAAVSAESLGGNLVRRVF